MSMAVTLSINSFKDANLAAGLEIENINIWSWKRESLFCTIKRAS